MSEVMVSDLDSEGESAPRLRLRPQFRVDAGLW
jgi:hypothetical protein